MVRNLDTQVLDQIQRSMFVVNKRGRVFGSIRSMAASMPWGLLLGGFAGFNYVLGFSESWAFSS